MKTLYVHSPFKVHHAGDYHSFGVGLHSFPPELLDHWYVKANTREPDIGTLPMTPEQEIAALEESIPRDQARLDELKAEKAKSEAEAAAAAKKAAKK